MIQKAIEFLEAQEGRRLKSYLDSAGVWTIGVGSTMYQSGKKVGPNETITDAQADALRDWEIAQKVKVIVSLLGGKITLTDYQMAALISFTYNEGVGALQQSTLLKVIKANPNDISTVYVNDVPDASVRAWMNKNHWALIGKIGMCFMMWNKVKNPKTGVKEFSEAMLQRRLREFHLYFSQ